MAKRIIVTIYKEFNDEKEANKEFDKINECFPIWESEDIENDYNTVCVEIEDI